MPQFGFTAWFEKEAAFSSPATHLLEPLCKGHKLFHLKKKRRKKENGGKKRKKNAKPTLCREGESYSKWAPRFSPRGNVSRSCLKLLPSAVFSLF